jgi:hypothetical protein
MATIIKKTANTFFKVLTGSLLANLTPKGTNNEEVTTTPHSAGK